MMDPDLKSLAGLLLLGILVYAMCCGVTIRGKHYGVKDCDGDRGVVLDVGEPAPSASSTGTEAR